DPDDLARVHPRRHAARALNRCRRGRAPLGGHRRDGRHARGDVPRNLLRADVLQAVHRSAPDREALDRGHQGRSGARRCRTTPRIAMNRFVLLAAVFIAGCAVQPTYERPAVELPQAWKESAPRFAVDGHWWKIYGDPVLDKLV